MKDLLLRVKSLEINVFSRIFLFNMLLISGLQCSAVQGNIFGVWAFTCVFGIDSSQTLFHLTYPYIFVYVYLNKTDE